MRLTDAHVHLFSHRFFSLLAGDPEATCEKLGWQCPPQEAEVLAERWVKEFDQSEVSRAALIASIPGDESSVLAAKSAFPERFFAYAMINPMKSTEIHPDLDAVCLFPAMHGYSMHSPEVVKVIEQTSTIFVHCGVLSVGVRKKLGLPSPFDMRFSNPLDLHAIALKFPGKRFIIPHFGAGMFREALMTANLCPNVYLDTSSSNSWMKYEGLDLQTVFRRAFDVVGAGRLLFGTDSSFFPRGWNRQVYEQQKGALDAIGISAQDQQRFFHDNLVGLLEAKTAGVAVNS